MLAHARMFQAAMRGDPEMAIFGLVVRRLAAVIESPEDHTGKFRQVVVFGERFQAEPVGKRNRGEGIWDREMRHHVEPRMCRAILFLLPQQLCGIQATNSAGFYPES